MLGMSRSGTSLTTRLLNLLGMYLGPREDLLLGDPTNADGHWENKPILRFNEWLLRSQGGSWWMPPDAPPGWERSDALARERCAARRFLEATFGGYQLWGWKDPRNCLTLPFWQHLLPGMRYVICLRNPIDVAASLGHSLDTAEAIFERWLIFVTASLDRTAGHPRLIVSYEDYFEDWRLPVTRLARFVGRTSSEGPPDGGSIEMAIKEKLRHHRTSTKTLFEDSRVPPEVRSLYREVSRLAAAEPVVPAR